MLGEEIEEIEYRERSGCRPRYLFRNPTLLFRRGCALVFLARGC